MRDLESPRYPKTNFKLAHHQLVISSEALQAEDNLEIPQSETKTYEVTAEEGIFKRGRLWFKGDIIDLDPITASRFIEANELKETNETS